MKIVVGADHRGFKLKNQIKESLTSLDIHDLTEMEPNPNDDYPIIARAVAQLVLKSTDTHGVVFCGSGVGVDIAANKINGIRCALGINPDQIKAARRDDNVNILAIAADYTTPEAALMMIDAFVNTQYEPTERRERRLNEITKLENEQ